MGEVFCQPRMTPVLPSRLARWMSSTVSTWRMRSERSRNRASHSRYVVEGLAVVLPRGYGGVDRGHASVVEALVDRVAVPVAHVQPVDDDGVVVQPSRAAPRPGSWRPPQGVNGMRGSVPTASRRVKLGGMRGGGGGAYSRYAGSR